MDSLIAKLEKAEAGSRELDFAKYFQRFLADATLPLLARAGTKRVQQELRGPRSAQNTPQSVPVTSGYGRAAAAPPTPVTRNRESFPNGRSGCE